MVNSSQKPKGYTPWRDDSQSIFGRDEPVRPWQMSRVEGDVEMCDIDGDEDETSGLRELQRRGKGSKRPIQEVHVSAPHLDRARDHYLDSLERTRLPWLVEDQPALASDVVEDDVFGLPHPVEIAMTGFVRGDSRYQSRWGVALKKSEWLSYIASHGLDLIPQLWLVHANETGDSTPRPYRVVVFGREQRSGYSEFSGVKILNANDPAVENLTAEQSKIWFDYVLASHAYHVTRAKGPGALQTAFEYLAACGLEVSTQVVRVYAARFLDGEFASNNLSWSELVANVADTPTLFRRMWDVRNHIKMSTEQFPGDFLFTVAKDESDRVFGVNLRSIQNDEVVKTLDKYAYLFIGSATGGKEFIRTVRGHSAQELGYAWITSQIGRPLDIVEKVMSVALWKSRFRSGDVPEWKRLCLYLQSENALERLWQVRDKIQPVGPMPDKLVLVARREVNIFSGLVVLTESEFEKWQTSKSTAVVHLEKDGKGKYQPISSKGTGAKEIIEALEVGNSVVAEGGVIFAPEMNDALEASLRPAPETFGNLDEKICKPEPLFTPSELMPVPQLSRPADAVDLPVAGGFQVTDPDAAKKFVTPPSDQIPVGVRARDESVKEIAAVSAMVVSIIAFFCGGAALLRAPMTNPAFGSGGVLFSPHKRFPEGT